LKYQTTAFELKYTHVIERETENNTRGFPFSRSVHDEPILIHVSYLFEVPITEDELDKPLMENP
jgi:hypothetical protein